MAQAPGPKKLTFKLPSSSHKPGLMKHLTQKSANKEHQMSESLPCDLVDVVDMLSDQRLLAKRLTSISTLKAAKNSEEELIKRIQTEREQLRGGYHSSLGIAQKIAASGSKKDSVRSTSYGAS